MNKNDLMKSLQKELHFQENLNIEISEKTHLLNQSKALSDMYKKWLRKLEQIEAKQIKREKELDMKMQDALKKVREYQPAHIVPKPAADENSILNQSLLDAENR